MGSKINLVCKKELIIKQHTGAKYDDPWVVIPTGEICGGEIVYMESDTPDRYTGYYCSNCYSVYP